MAKSYIGFKVDTGVPLFYFDGEKMPAIEEGMYDPMNNIPDTGNPAQGYLMKTEQLVRSTRNANGEVVSQKINRRLLKFDSLKWPILSRRQVVWLKQKVANFAVNVTYYDDEVDNIITRKFYFGDMSAEPFRWESISIDGGQTKYIKRPTMYKDVSVNIIDMRVLIIKKGENVCLLKIC